MAGDQDMMLRTRENQRLRPVALMAGDAGAAQHGVPWTPSDAPPHLRMVIGGDADPLPLPGEQRRARVGLSPAPGDSPSAIAVRGWFIQSLLVEAMMRDEAGHDTTAEPALERALEFAAYDRVLLPFLVDPVPDLLERHARGATAHADLIAEILELRAGLEGTAVQASKSLPDPLTESETRILRLLATDLSKREIGKELYVSVNTVKTHVRHLYAKLDVRTRRQAVQRARALGLLTHSSRNR
jgi:LuxR family maltose regulon positive regulatory protein